MMSGTGQIHCSANGMRYAHESLRLSMALSTPDAMN
jgi:hypothetical protein